MLYDRAAMRRQWAASASAPAARNSWKAGAAWQGGHLPAAATVTPERFQNLKPLLMVSSLAQGPTPLAMVLFSGERVTRFLGLDTTGKDWFSLIDPAHLPERTRRTASVAGGAMLKTIREVRLKGGGTQRFEMISLPLRPDADGFVRIFNYIDLPATAKNAVITDFREVTVPPVRAEFVPFPGGCLPCGAGRAAGLDDLRQPAQGDFPGLGAFRHQLHARGDENLRRAQRRSHRLSIILTIDTQNVAHVHDDPKISMRYAALSEPDWIRRGVSRAEVSRITQIPLETVRRRINRLIEMGVLADRKDGVIVPESNRMAAASRRRKMHINTQLIERLISDLDARGVPLS